jgi:hypothetical protein
VKGVVNFLNIILNLFKDFLKTENLNDLIPNLKILAIGIFKVIGGIIYFFWTGFYNVGYIIFRVVEKIFDNTKYTFRRIIRVLPKSVLFGVVCFLFLYIWIERNYKSNFRYKALLCPNLGAHIFIVYLYLLVLAQYVLPAADKVFVSTIWYETLRPFLSVWGGDAKYINLLMIKGTGSHLYNVLSIMSTGNFYIVKIIVQSNKDFRFYPYRLPMYVRYHLLNIGIMLTLFNMFDEPLNILFNICKKNPYITQTIFFWEKNPDPTKWIFEIYFILVFLIVGRGFLDAVRGLSFTGAIFDTLVLVHLGYEGLYKDERWDKFGLDPKLNRPDWDGPYFGEDDEYGG